MRTTRLLALLLLPLLAAACSKEADPRPLADLNLLKGRWVIGSNATQEIDVNPATRTAALTKVPAGNPNGFKVGDVLMKNIEAVDATTYRCETLYRATTGFFVYADAKLTLSGDELTQVTDIGSISGSLNVSGQRVVYKRVQ